MLQYFFCIAYNRKFSELDAWSFPSPATVGRSDFVNQARRTTSLAVGSPLPLSGAGVAVGPDRVEADEGGDVEPCDGDDGLWCRFSGTGDRPLPVRGGVTSVLGHSGMQWRRRTTGGIGPSSTSGSGGPNCNFFLAGPSCKSEALIYHLLFLQKEIENLVSKIRIYKNKPINGGPIKSINQPISD
jgi:hypothetical protein